MTSRNPPTYKIKSSHHFKAQVGCLSHLENTIRRQNLTRFTLALFRKTRFDHFLDINIIINGTLIHCLLVREMEEKTNNCTSFLLGGVICTFGRLEFDIIIGLWHPKRASNGFVANNRLQDQVFQR